MNFYFYFDPRMDQYVIKKINSIEATNSKYSNVNNGDIVRNTQITKTIDEAFTKIKTTKNITIQK